MNFVALDFETANSSRSSICAVGLAIVQDGTVIDSKHFYVKPYPNRYDPINISVHGITKSMTESQPSFDQLWKQIRPYFRNSVMLAHNAAFDFSVLRYALDAYELPYPDLTYHCSMCLSREVLDTSDHKLDTISRHFKIQLEHHNAESDAIAAAQIALRLAERMRVRSLEQLSEKLGFRVGRIHGKQRTYQPFSVIR